MYLVTVCDDKVSYYPTSRNFKITMNILRNQSDSVQSCVAFDLVGLFACTHTVCGIVSVARRLCVVHWRILHLCMNVCVCVVP